MGKRGPTKEATAKRRLRGNPSKRAMPKHEPVFHEAEVTCPEFLCDEAKAEWMRLYPELKANKLINPAFRAMFAAYCAAWADFKKLDEATTEHGYWERGQHGMYATPLLKQKRTAFEIMDKAARQFGFSPSYSADLGVHGQQQPEDEFSLWLKKKAENE